MPKIRTLLWRGCRKKCPQCGKGELYQRWAKFHDRCPECGLVYLPDQGDLWGPLLLLDRLVFMIPFIVIVYLLGWKPGWISICVCGGGLFFLLIYTLPHRNGISLAIDYLIRRKSGDLADEKASKQS